MKTKKQFVPPNGVHIVEWTKDLREKVTVLKAYADFESMRFRGETGMAVLEKLYPWLVR